MDTLTLPRISKIEDALNIFISKKSEDFEQDLLNAWRLSQKYSSSYKPMNLNKKYQEFANDLNSILTEFCQELAYSATKSTWFRLKTGPQFFVYWRNYCGERDSFGWLCGCSDITISAGINQIPIATFKLQWG